MSVSHSFSKLKGRNAVPKPVAGRLRRWTVLIVVQLILTLLFFEIGLRVAFPFSDGLRGFLYLLAVGTEFDSIQDTEELLKKSIMGFHPGGEFDGFLRNSRGFRTPEYQYDRSPGVLRVVVLGDSFASDSGGMPWRWMWPTLLEQQLQTTLNQEVEVINLGVPGVGPGFLLRLWELEVGSLNPDLVILSFFVGNDFIDEFPRNIVRRSLMVRLVRNGMRLWELRMEGRKLLVKKTVAEQNRMGMEVGEQREPTDPPFSPKMFLKIEKNRLKIVDAKSNYFESRFAAVAPVLMRFNASVRNSDAKLAIMIIPDEFQVNPELLATLKPSGKIDLELPQRRLAALLEQENIAYLDLLPVMQNSNRYHTLYLERDTHWNRAGNQLAAEELGRFLIETGLVP